jgi:hypothetical protein
MQQLRLDDDPELDGTLMVDHLLARADGSALAL